MKNRTTKAALLAGMGALLLPAAGAQAQYLTGITKPVFSTNQPEAFFVDEAGVSTFLFDIEVDLGIPATAPGFGGLAGDDANRRFFASVRNGPNDDIYEFSYDDLLNPTLLVATFGSTGQDVAIDGLAYDAVNGVLYATRTLASSGEAEGLFTVDLTTGTLTLVLDYDDAGSFLTIGGIDFNADDGLIYLADDDSTGGRFLYSFDPAKPGAGLVEVAEFPAAVTDVDGVAAGGGKVFLLTDNANSNGGVHYVYDLTSGTFSTIASPYPAPAGSPIAPNPSGGAAYTPGLLEGDGCPGDVTGDGLVDLADLNLVLGNFGVATGNGDATGDGLVDLADLNLVLGNFGTACN